MARTTILQKHRHHDTMMEMLGVQSQVLGGMPLPEWLAGWQIKSSMAEERITELVNAEFEARVRNASEKERHGGT